LWAGARVRHLKVLVEVSEAGSLHKAAAAVGLSQPAVTHVVADIERMLETPLFIRHARGMRLTEAGGQVVAAARRMLLEVDRVAEQTAALRDGATGIVRMAATGGAISGFLTSALPALARLKPRLLLQIQEADPAMMPGVLARREADLAILRAPGVVPSGWKFRSLISDRLIVMAGPHHPLACCKRVSMQQLRHETWFATPIDSVALKGVDDLFGIDKPLAPPLQITCRIPEILMAMLTSTSQVALLPFSVARQFLETGLLVELALGRELPLDPIGLLEPVDSISTNASFLAHFLCKHADSCSKDQRGSRRFPSGP
jgi:DNA-binding transcriptional LysR family regulator